jgi:non-canonical poly(A) RNA polymerase PAPD5/7
MLHSLFQYEAFLDFLVLQVSVDVSFDVPNGPMNVPKIKKYLKRYPALRPLVMVLKCFLQQRRLNEVFSGGIGSYCLILMVVSHFQMSRPARGV